MNVNYKLSAELKKKHNHEIRKCYMNNFNLLMKENMDYIVIGFIHQTDSNTILRHAWCIKDGQIIDSTFGDEKEYIENTQYFEAFRLTFQEWIEKNIMKNYPPMLTGYADDKELKVIKELEEKFNARYIEITE
jgi:monomeric isocitrate dehydrogenase